MKSSKYWYCLLLLTPFVNILNFRFGEMVSFLVMFFPFLMFILTGKSHKSLTNHEKLIYRFSVLSILLIVLGTFFSYVYSVNNLYYYRFFCLSFLLIPIFLLRGDSAQFIDKYLLQILKYYIVLISSSILLGAFLKNLGLDYLEPMYDGEKYYYLDRPFGIFGQPSVNSCILCFFYLFHRSASKLWDEKYNKGKDWLFWIVTAGVFLQGSGSGIISYLFVVLCKMSGKRNNISRIRISLIAGIVLFLVYKIVLSGIAYKISLEYITYLIDFVNDELINPYKKLILNKAFLLWGVPNFDLSIDFGPIYMMGTIGLVMTLFIFFFLFYMTIKARSLEMKLGIIMLIVGNLHYPVMFYMIMHFMWYVIIYYILVIDRMSLTKITSPN